MQLSVGLKNCRLNPGHNENKILVTERITVYAFSRTAPRKSGPFGAVQFECCRPNGLFVLGGLWCASKLANLVEWKESTM